MRVLLSLLACLVAPLALSVPAAAQQKAGQAAERSLAQILADSSREQDRARDEWRHPAETLAFFRVLPGQTVVDYTPAGGWWTRVLVPYLGLSGRYIALNPDVRYSPEMAKYYANTSETFPAEAAKWAGIDVSRIPAYNTDGLPTALNGTVDRILVFRAVHNLFRNGLLTRELTAMRNLLKADGLLGIEQHRAKTDAPAAYTDGSKGYMREKDVVALVEAHGFDLVAKSEINSNLRDTADYPGGVWTLPPSLEVEGEKARYRAIGESDRMTLLFRKRQ
ncbi:MAG: hypothetical protein EON58_09955 [Alphaproteobacteria bacterium]|nr:MAG: hypothetical protein EON58_09955 [Alphaproteobacteria bacterium]